MRKRKLLPILKQNGLWKRHSAKVARKEPALPPGTLVHIGERMTEAFSLRLIAYDSDHLEKLETQKIDASLRSRKEQGATWLHVTGLHEVDKIAELAGLFEVHPLVTEDILNSRQRAKIEIHDDYVFVVSKVAEFEANGQVAVQHFCLILTSDTVITFCEAPTAIFVPLIRRIEEGRGRIRKLGSDYLTWALLDAVVDHYFVVIDEVGEALSKLDEMLQQDITAVEAGHLYASRREVVGLHKLVRPLREICTHLLRGESPLLTEASQLYFRDLYDHSIHVIESTEELRELASNLRDFYLTAESNRMNKVMKVLTCVATIFLPLSFIAGVYGMNFVHMPELKHVWAYPLLWLVFVSVAGGMLWLFFRKKWL